MNLQSTVEIKGTLCIKSMKSTPSHMKEISLTCAFVIEYKKVACSFRMFENVYVIICLSQGQLACFERL